MKLKSLFAATLFVWMGVACTQPDKTVEYPFIETANTMTLDIAKVELSDSVTVLHTEAYFQPKFWIQISSQGYLLADGKRYALKRTEGIDMDTKFWMPDSGEASFRLIFEPLPKHTKSFDYIEADDCPDCFKLYGISLDAAKATSLAYDKPAGVPADVMKVDPNASVPDPVFEVGETTVNIHLLGYRKDFGNEAILYLNSFLSGQEPYTIKIDEETGTGFIKFMQYGPAQATLQMGQSMGNLWFVPGETMDVYMDLRITGWKILKRRADKRQTPKPETLQFVCTTGQYANLNNVVGMRMPDVSRCSLNLYDCDFFDDKTSADQYTQLLVDKYNVYADSIMGSTDMPVWKEFVLLNLKQELLEGVVDGNYFRELAYRRAHNQWDRSVKVEGIDPMRPEHLVTVCNLFDVYDPKLLMAENVFGYVNSLCSPLLQAKRGLASNLSQLSTISSMSDASALTEEDFKKLEALDDPFFLKAFKKMKEVTEAQLAAVADKSVIEPTPEVPNEKLLEAILAPYKGKVVLVDFWNTWCGPCRASIKANEPLKSGELKSDQLVWLYIANETSPMVKYRTMIAEIEGKHYRLNDKQWAYLCGKLKISGIPSYVLVDKSGSYKLRNDFRNHDTLKEELKKMIQ